MNAAVLLLGLQLAAGGPAGVVPTGARASAARAEAEAFVALEEHRDCDAALAFLRAHHLAADERLVVNAALALQRFGDRAGALALLESVRSTTAGLDADAGGRAATLAAAIRAEGPGARCAQASASSSLLSSSLPSSPSSPLLTAGVASMASGLVVGGSAVGTWLWLDQGVLRDPRSSGGAKDAALGARTPVLAVGGALAGLLVVAGAVLMPLSLESQEAR